MSGKKAARIVVVDDTEANRYTVTHFLKRAGFEVWEAATGGEGLELARRQPDLIILDIKLPDIVGYELSGMLKADPGTSGIPILQVSATYLGAQTHVRSLESGADAYLSWPFDADELLANVKALLRMRRAEQIAKENSDRLEFILSTITDSHFVLDAQYRFVQVNKAAQETFFRRSEKELLGQAYWQVFPGTEESDLGAEYIKAFKEERPVHSELQSRVSNRWYEVHIYPRGELLEVYLRDITERRNYSRRLEEEVQKRTTELQQSNKELESFGYTISHDLRAPLRAISGYAGVLQKQVAGQLNEEQRRYLQAIMENAIHMGVLVDALLNFSRLGRKGLERSAVDMRALFEAAVREQQEAVHETRQSCDVSVAPDIPPAVGDPTLLRQVAVNLVSNAFKFSGKKNHVVIRVEASAAADQPDYNVYSVSDKGTGFDMRHADKLFGVFQRLHTKEEFEGTGIGLAFAKRIVERHGGRIWAEAAPGEGARFSFTLPRVLQE